MSEQTKQARLKVMMVPFDKNEISKLPKPTANREKMAQLPKAKCDICGGYHATSNILHLDYVGHAAITKRLLEVDPEWSWEPFSTGPDGLPALDKNGGLWIRLTVLGTTRIGYGDAPGKAGGDAIKEAIGDALRNASMRFGAALELWHKGDLFDDDDNPVLSKIWVEQIAAAKSIEELETIWKEGVDEIKKHKDMTAYNDLKDAFIVRKKELTDASH